MENVSQPLKCNLLFLNPAWRDRNGPTEVSLVNASTFDVAQISVSCFFFQFKFF